MKCNVGKIDKTIRMVLGIGAMALGYYFKSWWGALGIIFVITSLINWCPIYAVIGMSTCEKTGKKA